MLSKKLSEVLDGTAMNAKEFKKDRRFHLERIVAIRAASEHPDNIPALCKHGVHHFILETMHCFPEDVTLQYMSSEILLNMSRNPLGRKVLLDDDAISHLKHAHEAVRRCRDDIFMCCTERAIETLSSPISLTPCEDESSSSTSARVM